VLSLAAALTLLTRVFLAAVLVVSAATKATPSGRAAFKRSITELFGARSRGLTSAVLVGTVALELGVAAGLALGVPTQALALLAGSVLFTIFTIVLAPAIARRQRATCACFGALSHRQVGLGLVVRNETLSFAGLAALAVTGPMHVLVVAAILVGLGLYAVQTVALLHVSRGIHTPVPAPARQPFEPPATGVPVPAFDAPGAGPTDVVLAFLSPGCGSCVDAVATVQEIVRGSRLRAVAVIDPSAAHAPELAELRQELADHRVPVAEDADRIVEALDVRAFPSFAVVDARGVVVSSCLGVDGLRELVAFDGRPIG